MSASPSSLPAPRLPHGFAAPSARHETPAQRARRAARDRQRKLDRRERTRTPEQKQALALAAKLKDALRDYPALKTEINEFLYVLHQRGHETPDRVGDGVRQALATGCNTVEDICDETRFSELSVINVLDGMRALGLAKEVNDGRGRLLWVLTGKAATTTMVLP